MIHQTKKIWRLVLVVLLLGALGERPGVAQVKVQVEEAVAEPAVATRADDRKVKKNEEKYAGGAALKTDADLEDQLKKAATFVREKNYRFATILWDRVLEKSDNSLITKDGETYISLVKEVEETIRNLPPNGLQVYRISADGKAKALMPGDPAEADDESLSKLVRLFFMSSIGDEAAFELGCRALDQRDFVSASRLYNKVLNEHPDPSVDRNQVLLRLAIAAGNLGDREAAEKSLAELSADNVDYQDLVNNVRQHLGYLKQSNRSVSESGDSIAMRLSNSDRSGLMPDLPDDVLSGDLTQGYEFRFPFVFTNNKADSDLGSVVRGGSAEQKASDPAIAALSKKWRAEKWFPSNQLLFNDGKIVLKTTNDLVCIDSTGKSKLALWHSLWLNHFELDEASFNAKTYAQQIRNRNGSAMPINFPKDEKEAWYFYDRIRQSMAVHQGVVYTVEGKNYSQLDESVPRTRRSTTTRSYNQPVNLIRSRTNFLTAYDLVTGKVLWTRSAYEKSASESSDAADTKVGFLGTPVPFGNLLICPVTEGGAISIYALDSRAKGKTVWKTFLCDDPTQGVDYFAPVEITIAGQDAYVTCGTGVLFSLNAASGNIQFARRYQRDGKIEKVQTSYNQFQEMLLAKGWDDNVVVTWKNALIVMAADHDYVFAIDRRNGEFLWDAPRLPFDEDVEHAYCLGHYDDKLIMATNKGVLCYNLAGDGKLQWYKKLGGNSFGRGFLTSKAVYIPVEDSIVKFDLETGKKITQVGVNLGTENKVGNLFSDGKQIWVVGMNRVIALRSLRDRLVELETLIEQGSSVALRERFGIYNKLEEYDKSLDDAIRLFDKEEDRIKAFRELGTNLKQTGLLEKVPVKALGFLNSLLVDSGKLEPIKATVSKEYQVFFDAANSAKANGHDQASKIVLEWSRLSLSEGFGSAVSRFLVNHQPSAGDLQKALSTATDEQVKLLIPAATKSAEAGSLLTPLLNRKAESIRISTANELALLGKKECLPAALDLLSSADLAVRTQAYLILKNVTGAKISFNANAAEDERKKAIAEWGKWIGENLETLEVKLPVTLRFGRILVGTTSKILEFDPEEGLTNETGLKGYKPEDLSTTRTGSRLVVEYSARRIVELDLAGKEIVKISTKSLPRSARKLANGNYLVTWRNSAKPVVELDPKGKVVWETRNLTGYAISAERLANGHTLIAFEKRVIEVDADSKVVYEIGAAQSISNCKEAKRLPNGNTMIVHGTSISIFDPNKNAVLKIRGSFRPKSAVYLPDGRILVGHQMGLRLFDKEGTKVGDDFVNENVNAVWNY